MQKTHTHVIYDANIRGFRQGGVCVDVDTVRLDGALISWANIKSSGKVTKIPLCGRRFGHHSFGNCIEVILRLCCVPVMSCAVEDVETTGLHLIPSGIFTGLEHNFQDD